jgi:hypothetical protein
VVGVIPPLQIIATSDEGTRAALKEARQFIRRQKARQAVLLVPWTTAQAVVTTPENVDAVEDYRRMADKMGVDVTVRLCLGATHVEISRWMLPAGSTTIVGGRRRWWWPTQAQRVAHALKRAGHDIIFADASERDLSSA